MTLRISTVDSTVYINDLGLVLEHPTVDRDISLEFTSDELRQSTDLTTAIQAGDLTVDDGTFTIASADYDPHTALSHELQLHLDSRFISHAELSAGYQNVPIEEGVFPLSLNSTAASTRNVYVPAARWGTWQISAGDVVVITGSSAADGSYTVESISDHQNFIVVESIADSTGGNISVYHPNAAGLIGVDDNNFNNVSGVLLQDVLESIDSKLNVTVDDDKVLVSDNDTTPGFLEEKLVAGSGIDITVSGEGGNEYLHIENTLSDDHKILVSDNDTSPDYCENKIIAGNGIDINVLYEGGNEVLEFTNTYSGVDVYDEGVLLTNSPHFDLNFIGDGVLATASGDNTAQILIDKKIKITANDTTPEYLFNKIVVGPGLNVTHLNDGGDELLQLAANAGEFGTQFYAVYDATESTTTSTAWQEKLTLSVSGIEEGSYYLIWCCEVSQDIANLQVDLKLELNHTDVLNETEIHFQTGGIWMIGIGAVVRQLSAGDHLFDLDFHSSQNGKQCRIRKSSIILWRVV